MKKLIISYLRKRGLNDRGEANLLGIFDVLSIVLKLILIPFIGLGIFTLGTFLSYLFQIILNN